MALPIRARLTLWYSTTLALIILGFSGFLGYRLRSDLLAGLDETLGVRAQQITLDLRGSGFQDVGDVGPLPGLRPGSAIAQLVARDGRVLQEAGSIAGQAALVPDAVLQAASTSAVRGDIDLAVGDEHEPYRYLALRIEADRILVVADSTEQVELAARRLTILLLVGGPASISVCAIGGWLLASRSLRPIDRMTRAAAAIGSDDLSARLEAPVQADEVGRLAGTLNQMLARLQTSIEEQRRFTSDASHELRTPLAIMRAELDVALRSPETPEQARPTLLSASEEVDRMAALVNDLLTLARADEGGLKLTHRAIDLADLTIVVADRFRSRALSDGVALATEPSPATVLGDEQLLEQLVSNLLGNAIAYTPRGGTVRLTVGAEGSRVTLSVSDTGDGIPADALPQIFDRFYRVDRARARVDGGAGLGLAICRSITESHSGTITVQSVVGEGTIFTVVLPAA